MAARSFLGAGDVLIEAIVNGVGQGLEGPFKANKLALKPNVDKKQSTSKGRDDYGQVLESVNLPLPADLTLELKEVVGSVLAMALMGTATALTASAGTLADHPVVIKKGKWVSIGQLNLDATITVENDAGTTTYDENDDYKLNRRLGLLMVLPGSAIADGATLKVSGAYDGASGTRISGATQSEVRCRIVFDGVNMADGTDVTAEVWEAVLSAESEFDFLPDDFGNVTLTGTAKTPTGKTEPFVVDMKTPAA